MRSMKRLRARLHLTREVPGTAAGSLLKALQGGSLLSRLLQVKSVTWKVKKQSPSRLFWLPQATELYRTS